MSEDAERDTDNPGPFETPTELGSVCTSLALEEVARLRDAEREAYRRGALDAIRQLKRHRQTVWPDHHLPQIALAAVDVGWLDDLRVDIQQGIWPKGGDDARS